MNRYFTILWVLWLWILFNDLSAQNTTKCSNVQCINTPDSLCHFQNDLIISCNEMESYTSQCMISSTGDIQVDPFVQIHTIGNCRLVMVSGGRITLGNKARIGASSVEMVSSEIIMHEHSIINVTGKGSFNGSGYGNQTFGASYGGSGGRRFDVCPVDTSFSNCPSTSQSGSCIGSLDLHEDHLNKEEIHVHTLGTGSWVNMNKTIMNQVYGGGRIRMNASNFLLMESHSILEANGQNAFKSGGGSGGSIGITSTALTVKGLIHANGGNGKCIEKQCFPAGGGGRIYLNYASHTIPSNSISAIGGLPPPNTNVSMQRCLSGGAGTVYYVSDTGKLHISNQHHSNKVLASTPFSFLDSLPQKICLSNLVFIEIDQYATVMSMGIMFSEQETISSSIQLSNHASIVGPKSIPTIQFAADEIGIKTGSTIVHRQNIKLDGQSLQVDVTSRILSNGNVLIRSVLTATIVGSLSGFSRDSLTEPSSLFTLHSNPFRKSYIQNLMIHGQTVACSGIIRSNFISLFADKAINLSGDMMSTSNQCELGLTWNTCLKFNNFPSFLNSIEETWMNIVSHYTIRLVSRHSITIGQSMASTIVAASSILMCADEMIIIPDGSHITTDAKGCACDHGLGKGVCVPTRVGSLGTGAGFGGLGGAIGNGSVGGLTYGDKKGEAMLGSGGGCINGGSGGGIIHLSTKSLFLNGSISANGGNGNDGGGGGSGGYLDLHVRQYLEGAGSISCNGGHGGIINSSDVPNLQKIASNASQGKVSEAIVSAGGGGGGGRLKLLACSSTIDLKKCTGNFVGTYSVLGGVNGKSTIQGQPGEDGTLIGLDCPPGYGGVLCHLCPIGTFQDNTGNYLCHPCTNAPEEAHYIGNGTTTPMCQWACNPGYSGKHCLTPLQQLLDTCGGVFGFIFIGSCCIFLFVVVGCVCRQRNTSKHRHGGLRDRKDSSNMYTERQPSIPTYSSNKWGWWAPFRCCFLPRIGYPKLLERDLCTHLYRIYLSGENRPNSPWKLSTVPPSDISSIIYEDSYKGFAQRINRLIDWPEGVFSSWGSVLYVLLTIFCYPMVADFIQYQRYKRLNALKRVMAKYNHAFMRGPRARALFNALKLGFSADFSNVFIEVLYTENEIPSNSGFGIVGKPRLPLVLLFSGCGTYTSPYYLDPNDLIVRSIPQCSELSMFIDDAWIELVAELNTLLRTVHHAALAQSLTRVIKFLEQKSMESSTLGGLQIQLGRFWTDESSGYSMEQHKLGIFLFIGNSRRESIYYSNIEDSSDTKVGPLNNKNPSEDQDSLSTSRTSLYTMERLIEYAPVDDVPEWCEGNMMNEYPADQDLLLHDTIDPNSPSASIENLHLRQSIKHSIRDEALRVRASTSGSLPNEGMLHYPYEKLCDPSISIDFTLPYPGILWTSFDLRLAQSRTTLYDDLKWMLWRHLLPCNVSRNKWLPSVWVPVFTLMILLLLDVGITFATLVNLRCIKDGKNVEDCSAFLVMLVVLIYPFAIIVAPVVGILALSLSNPAVARKYSTWNALSKINVLICIFACLFESSNLVAPWFTRPVPVIPVILLAFKCAEGIIVEHYIANLETRRERRGWRGLISSRDSDVSTPPTSPYMSPDRLSIDEEKASKEEREKLVAPFSTYGTTIITSTKN